MTGKVAFCVVAWNSASELGECLAALTTQTGVESSVFLLDNGSTDNSREVVARFPGVRATWSDVNHGFARGNNILIAQALADPAVEYVALINADAVLDRAWGASLVSFAEQRGNVGSLQGLTLDYFDHTRVDSQHICVTGRLQGVQCGYGDPVSPPGEYYPRKVFGVNAAACMYTRAMIEALPDRAHGFFDERFFMYYEDIDVSFRALLAGWDAWFVPAALAYHMGSVSARKRESIYSPLMVARNQPAVIFKNVPTRVLLRSFGQTARGVVAFLREVARNHGIKAAAQVARSFVQGTLALPQYRTSRRAIQAARTMDDNYLMRILHSGGILG